MVDYVIPDEPGFYECEYFALGGWHTAKTRDLAWVNQHIKEDTIRVRKLSDELLIQQGWQRHEQLSCFLKGKQHLLYRGLNNTIVIQKLGSGTVYKGECITINDLIAISKLLKI